MGLVMEQRQCLCTKVVRSNQKSLVCDLCDTKFHSVCLKLDSALSAILLDSNILVPWTCNQCKDELRSLKTENAKLMKENISLHKTNESLIQRISSIETQISQIKNSIKDEILKELQGNSTTVPVSGDENFQKQIATAVYESKLMESKKLNLCVSGFPNPALQTNDVSNFATIIEKNVGIKANEITSNVTNSARIGKIDENKPQLLILTFSLLEMKRKVLLNSKKLKDYRTRDRGKIFIFPDLTPKQRSKNQKLVTELVTRREKGESVVIKHGKIVARTSNNSE